MKTTSNIVGKYFVVHKSFTTFILLLPSTTTMENKGSKDKTKRRQGVGPSLRVDDDADNEKDGGSIAIPRLEDATAPSQSTPYSQALVPYFGPPPSSSMPAATTTAVSLQQKRQLAQVDSTPPAEEKFIIAAQERAWELAKSRASSTDETHQKSKKNNDIEMACNPRPQRQPGPYLFEEEQDEDASESDDEDRYPGAVRFGGANDNSIDDGDGLHTIAESTTVSPDAPVILTAHVVDEDAEDVERERIEQLEEEVRRFRERERNTAIATAAASSVLLAEEVGQLNTTTTTSAPVGEQGGERTKGGDESQQQLSTDCIKRSKYATAIALCLFAIIIIIAATVPTGGGNNIASPDTGADAETSSPTPNAKVTPTETPTSFPTSSPENNLNFTSPSPEECNAIASRDAPKDNNDLVAYSVAAEIDVYVTFSYNPRDKILNKMLLESLQREVAPLLAGCEETPNRRRDLKDENKDELSSKIVNVEFENVADRGMSCEEVDNVGSCIPLVVDFTVFVDGEKEIEASHMVAPFQHGITNVVVDGVTRIRFVGLGVSFEAPSPTKEPELWPTTESPTYTPTRIATDKPTDTPTLMPTTAMPSATPMTSYPTTSPSTSMPSVTPSEKPIVTPGNPTMMQTTATPSATQTTGYPSTAPSTEYPFTAPITPTPSQSPTMTGSDSPTSQPTTPFPSSLPSSLPSAFPTSFPSSLPSSLPSAFPTLFPSSLPSSLPSAFPTSFPSSLPSSLPSAFPTSFPSSLPSSLPSAFPTSFPSSLPSSLPSAFPTSFPSNAPSSLPSAFPTSFPSSAPSSLPSAFPTSFPSSSLQSASPAPRPTW